MSVCEIDDDLLATCAGLGYTEGELYYRGEECWECVKDLISFLKLDDVNTCSYRLQMGTAQTVQKDLLPILVNFMSDEKLMDVVIRVLLNLTQPSYACMGNQKPSLNKRDLMNMGVYIALDSHLRRYKEAFTNEEVFQALGSLLGKFCQKDWESRTDDDVRLVERILGIVRNILHVPSDPAEEQRTDDDVSLHDQIIWSMHLNGFFELLAYIASSTEEQDWILYVLEIIFLMMREQSASSLSSALRGKQTVKEQRKEERELEMLVERERLRKLQSAKRSNSRHSRFLGSYVCLGMKGIADRPLIYHKALQDASNMSFDDGKRGKKINRRRAPAKQPPPNRQSTLSIRKVLADFCMEFLQCCYNPTMTLVRGRLTGGRCQDNDETYFLFCMRFFMEFHRLYDFKVEVVGATLTMETFNFVMTRMFVTFESMQIAKGEEARPWARRLHYAVQAYRELLLYLQAMANSDDDTLKDNVKIMQGNIFYIPEYRDIFISLLRNYDPLKSDKAYLGDLVETVHLYIKLIEKFCQGRQHIYVRGKKKKAKHGKKAGKKRKSGWHLSDDQLQDLWEEHADGIATALQDLNDTGDAVPFDAASQLPDDMQRATTAGHIRDHILSSAYQRAVGLFRAARDLWSDGMFGTQNCSAVEEVTAMRAIFLEQQEQPLEEEDGGDEQAVGGEVEEGDGGELSYELEFNLKTYIARFATSRIVRTYVSLLNEYQQNSYMLNHCIVKMLYRIAHDCGLLPLMLQLSSMMVFNDILNDPTAQSKHMTELYKFAVYVTRGLINMAAQNPVMYVEVLFWKDANACFEIQNGYGAMETAREEARARTVWTEDQESELTELYAKHRDAEDMVEAILADLTRPPERTSRQVKKKLIKMELISREDLQKKKPLKRKGGVKWTETQDKRLRALAEQFGTEHAAALDAIAMEMEGISVDNIKRRLIHLKLLIDPDDLVPSDADLSSDDDRDRRKGKDDHVPSDTDLSSDDDNSSRRQHRQASSSGKDGVSLHPPTSHHRTSSSQRKHKRKHAPQQKIKPARRKRKDHLLKPAVLQQLVLDCHDKGLEEAIHLVQESLQEEAGDRANDDDDEWVDMPIVPITASCQECLDDQLVSDLLQGVGLCAPDHVQHAYWRIPATLTPSYLRKTVDMLNKPTQDSLMSVDKTATSEAEESGDGEGRESSSEEEEKDEEKSEEDAGDISEDDLSDAESEKEKDSASSEEGNSTGSPAVEEAHQDDRSDKTARMAALHSLASKRSKVSASSKQRSRTLMNDSEDEDSDEDSDSGQLVISTSPVESVAAPTHTRSRCRVMLHDSDESDEESLPTEGPIATSGEATSAQDVSETPEFARQPEILRSEEHGGRKRSFRVAFDDSDGEGSKEVLTLEESASQQYASECHPSPTAGTGSQHAMDSETPDFCQPPCSVDDSSSGSESVTPALKRAFSPGHSDSFSPSFAKMVDDEEDEPESRTVGSRRVRALESSDEGD